MGGDGPFERAEFNWEVNGSMFTARFDGRDHTSKYEIQDRGEGRCFLLIDPHPFVLDRGTMVMANGPLH